MIRECGGSSELGPRYDATPTGGVQGSFAPGMQKELEREFRPGHIPGEIAKLFPSRTLPDEGADEVEDVRPGEHMTGSESGHRPEVAPVDRREVRERRDVVPPAEWTDVPISPATSSEQREHASRLADAHPGVRLPDHLIDRIADSVRNASTIGESCENLRDAIEATVRTASRRTEVVAVFDRAVQDPATAVRSLRTELRRCEVGGDGLILPELERLEHRIEEYRSEPVEVSHDSQDRVHLGWGDEEPTDPANRGRLVLVGVDGAQAGDDNTQVNVFVHVIDDPAIDLEDRLLSPEVQDQLGQLSATPHDHELRQTVYDALSEGAGRPGEDWTESFVATGTATFGWCTERLNGSVAVIRSRGVQVGDHLHQDNKIVHSVSPTIDGAALLASNAELVNSFIDMACSPGDRAAAQRFTGAIDTVLTTELAGSRAALAGHGTIHRPPAAGRSLTIRDQAGVSVGRRASQKNHHLYEAHLGRQLARSTHHVTTGVQRAAKAFD